MGQSLSKCDVICLVNHNSWFVSYKKKIYICNVRQVELHFNRISEDEKNAFT